MKIPQFLCKIELRRGRADGSGGVSPCLMELVCKEFPAYVSAYGWDFVGVSHEDPLVHKILFFFKEIGLDLPMDQSRMNTGITYSVYRSDHDDFVLNAPFTSAALVGSILADFTFDDSGEPFVVNNSRVEKQKGRAVGGIFAFPQIVVVRETLKDDLSKAGLIGLVFRPLRFAQSSSSADGEFLIGEWPEDVEPIYQVYSETELPVCKNWMCDNRGRVFHPSERVDLKDGCLPLNGLERSGALHYAYEEIAPYLSYDVVRSYENLRRGIPEVLVSKRFRQVFKELGIKGMKYNLGYYAVIDESPWPLGTDGPPHPRYSGPPPNLPVD